LLLVNKKKSSYVDWRKIYISVLIMLFVNILNQRVSI